MANYYYIISKSKRSQKYYDLFINKIPKDWTYNSKKYEYLFIIGGDGTLFRSSDYFYHKDCKVILINGGTFGFYASFDEKNVNEIFDHIINENNYITPKIIEISINKEKHYSINDILVSSYHACPVIVSINNEVYETFKGTGFLFSTPLGSTAFNKSANGAVIIDNIDCYQMVEIQPVRQLNFNTLGSPIILCSTTSIKLNILDNKHYFSVIIDGTKLDILISDEILIKSISGIFKLFNPNHGRLSKIKKAFIGG